MESHAMHGQPARSRELLRRASAPMLAVAVLFLASLAGRSFADVQTGPPNIVLIMADDLGYGALGCYGQTKIETPHIDRLAAEGIRFTQAYAGSHVCQPSRSVLMTGLHTGHTACRANDTDQRLLPEDVTVAELLQQRGYATGGFGKWGLGYEGTTGHPNLQGFDEFFGQLLQVHAHFYYPYWVWKNDQRYLLPGNEQGRRGQYVQDEIHAQALQFLRANADRPFFAYLPYIIPHVELVVPEDSEAPYRGKFPTRAILDPRPGYLGSEDGLATYAGMISRLDRYVGEILQVLEELGIDDNTIVLFTSDNGGQHGGKEQGWTAMTDFFAANGSFRGYKGSFYEGGIRVPLIVRWPGHISPEQVTEHVCGFQDLLPTLCELTGAATPETIDGISFAPTLLGRGGQRQHEFLYWEYPQRNGLERAARRGDWKAYQPRPEAPIELYHLASDAREQRNLAAEHAEIVQEIAHRMNAAHKPPREYPAGAQPTIEDFVR